MKRAQRFERRARFMTTVAVTLLVIGSVSLWSGVWCALNGHALAAIGLAVLMVASFEAIGSANSRARHLKALAESERKFETIETLSSPRWHGAKNENDNN